MRTAGWVLAVASCLLLSGCPGAPTLVVDVGPGGDAGDGGRDAAMDATSADAPPIDAQADALPFDAMADAAETPDGGSSPDDAGMMDVLTPIDAGMDAFSPVDAGMDAGPPIDAPTTTCTLVVAPPSGTTADTFTVTIASNGSACMIRIDGTMAASVPCTISTDVPGSFVGPGTHTVELLVGGGPGGPTSCSTTVDVTAGPDAGPVDAGVAMTSCALSVTPPTGTTADSFLVDGASNGSACTMSVDGAAPMPVPCTFSFPTMIPAGTHLLVLSVGDGPTGPTSCMTSVTVTAAPDAGVRDAGTGSGTTTCTVDVSPPSGTTTTTYTITATSNGTGCTMRFDGSAPLSVPCTGSTTVPGSGFGVGSHTIEMTVADGPGGAAVCSDTFVVAP